MSEPITLNGEAVYECMPDHGQFPVTWPFAAQGDGYKHAGVDVGTPEAVTLVGPAPGISVPFTNSETWWTWPPGTEARWVKSFGEAICIDHGVGRFRYTLIAHCSRLLVAIGDRVIAGQPIAFSGSTGVAAGSHYHMQRGDTTAFPRNLTNNVDPLKYLLTEEQMDNYRWGLTNLLERPWWEIVAIYDKLSAAGFFAAVEAAEGVPGPVDGNNDTNDIMLRVRRIQGLAGGPRALEAAKLLGVA